MAQSQNRWDGEQIFPQRQVCGLEACKQVSEHSAVTSVSEHSAVSEHGAVREHNVADCGISK